ncbi:MAG: TIGR00725 family protein [Calditrichia bacterium]|nr:TIGR00725 family protein [Calditrichia bacterium]
MKKLIAVIGAGDCEPEIYDQAYELGQLLSENGFTVVCGGLGGVMEAVCKGIKSKNGTTIGILPGNGTSEANQYVDFGVATGMGIGRNIIIIRSASVVIAVNGKFGTLSEVAFALQLNKPVIGLNTWDVSDQILEVKSPQEALIKVKEILNNV